MSKNEHRRRRGKKGNRVRQQEEFSQNKGGVVRAKRGKEIKRAHQREGDKGRV